MARLLVKASGLSNQTLELTLGITRVGRSPDADFTIDHPTVSRFHCEFHLSEAGVTIRDLDSSNGTFLENEPIHEAQLSPGQTIRLGDVDLFVETTEATVAIPKFINPELPAPPVVLSDGSLICPRHERSQAAFRCTECKEVMCDVCVHRVRRRGSRNVLLLCPVCSKPVEPIGGPRSTKKRSFFSRAGQTVKLELARRLNLNRDP